MDLVEQAARLFSSSLEPPCLLDLVKQAARLFSSSFEPPCLMDLVKQASRLSIAPFDRPCLLDLSGRLGSAVSLSGTAFPCGEVDHVTLPLPRQNILYDSLTRKEICAYGFVLGGSEARRTCASLAKDERG
jgi:hypothetical protein